MLIKIAAPGAVLAAGLAFMAQPPARSMAAPIGDLNDWLGQRQVRAAPSAPLDLTIAFENGVQVARQVPE